MYFLASRAEARMNWLSRLRSAKGFPAEPPGLGIDDFLHSGASSPENRSGSPALSVKLRPEGGGDGAVKAEIHDGGDYLRSKNSYFSSGARSCRPKSRAKKKKKTAASSAVKAETAEWLDVTSNALAELFCMREEDDELTEGRRKKRRRKQVKPRICASSSSNANLTPSTSADGDNSVQNTVKPSPSPPRLVEDTILTPLPLNKIVVAERISDRKTAKTSSDKKRKGFRQQINGTPDARDTNSPSYSTEVTVIDTSVEPLKFRKLIYRKGAASRVREKKTVFQSVSDKCTTVGSLDEGGLHVERPKRKAAKSRSAATSSPSSRTVDHDNAAEFSSVKVQTGRHHSHSGSSPKDTDGHEEVRTEIEEHEDNRPNSRNRKRLLYSGSIDCSKDGIRQGRRATTEEKLDAAPQSNLSPDHPVNQPMETLVFSLYQVFLQAGKSGLTAREAVSRILEKGLPGLNGGGIVPRIEVAKTLRTSPYFMQLEESKFVLCSAVIGNEAQHLLPPVNLQESKGEVIAEKAHEKGELEKKEDHSESLQDWATLAAIRKIRTKRRSLPLGPSNDKPCLSKESAGREGEVICS